MIIWSENVLYREFDVVLFMLEDFHQGNIFGWWAHDELQYENGSNDQF